LSIRVPGFGDQDVELMAPETIPWNGSAVVTWRQKPDITWTETTAQRSAYEVRLVA
jgi:hypothetical protein